MGKTNVAVNNWLSNNKRFADLFNGVIFNGEQIIQPAELEGILQYWHVNHNIKSTMPCR